MKVPGVVTPIRGFRIDDNLYSRVKEAAAEAGVTASHVVRTCLEEWLERAAKDPSEPAPSSEQSE